MDLPANAGACTGNLSCAYTHTLSWRSPTQPLPMEWNPRTVFEKLFGDSGSTDRAAREARLQQHKSILDSVNGKLAGLKQELGPQDQVKVDEYTDAVRDVERRIQMAEQQSDIELPAMEQPLGAPPVFEDHLALMMDLQVLAFQSDLTRVISFMLSKEQSARPYPQIGVPEAHHPLSHHNNIPELIEKMSKINRYHAQLFSQYLAKLRATPDGDGSLLDHMTILYGAGISNSNGHSGDNLPLMLVGGGAGQDQGRPASQVSPTSLRTANLLVTLMDKMDYPVEKVGGSTGKLPHRHAVRRCKHEACACDPGCGRRLVARGAVPCCLMAADGGRAAAGGRGQERRQGRAARRCFRRRPTSTPPKPMAPRRCIGPAIATIWKAPTC